MPSIRVPHKGRAKPMNWLTESSDGVTLSVRVIPRAAKDKVDGVLGDALKVRLQAPPVEGKANEALRRFLARATGIPPGRVQLLSGRTGRNKRVLLCGVDAQMVRARLGV